MAKGITFFEEGVQLKINRKRSIINWIVDAVKAEDYEIKNLNIVFCNDEYLLGINTSYLNQDTYTDIITFDYTEDGKISGEIYISIDRVQENSEKFNVSLDNEMLRVIIHGVLHLCGYADTKHEERKQMTEKENYYLSLYQK